jgi:hypothetical protein
VTARSAAYCAREHRLWWRVAARNVARNSNGTRNVRSEYSTVVCLECPRHWRTKAAYVPRLRDLSPAERAEFFHRPQPASPPLDPSQENR